MSKVGGGAVFGSEGTICGSDPSPCTPEGTSPETRSSRNPERCFAGLIVAINMCLANSAEFKSPRLHISPTFLCFSFPFFFFETRSFSSVERVTSFFVAKECKVSVKRFSFEKNFLFF